MHPLAALRRRAGRPLVVGHRGVRGQAPTENTPAAFAAAAAAGADWVEVDARRSADGVAVVYHDGWTPDGRPVVERTAAELRELGIYALSEVLATMPPAVGVDLEVKNLPGEPDFSDEQRVVAMVADDVRACPTVRLCLTSSFNPLTLTALAAALPDVPTALIHYESLSLDAAAALAAEFGAAALCPRVNCPDLDATTIARVHTADLAVLVWTVNDLERAVALAAAGVDGLFTDDPAAVRERLDAAPSGAPPRSG